MGDEYVQSLREFIRDEFRHQRHHFDRELHRLRRLIVVATQVEIDALTDRLDGLSTQLRADDSALQTAIANLQSQGVDVTELTTAVEGLASDVDATTALVPTEPAPEPTPAPEPAPEPPAGT